MAKRTIHFEFKHRGERLTCLVAPGKLVTYDFKSRTVESRWAKILEFMVRAEQVLEWSYEPQTFDCGRKYRKDRRYTLDFCALDNGVFDHPGEDVWFETKSIGLFKQKDISRLRWFAQSHPDYIVFLVFDKRPRATNSKTSQRQRCLISKAEKLVERVLYMDDFDK